MDSLFEQGYHGRATALTLEPTARVTGRSSLLSLHFSSTTSLVKLRQPASLLSARYRHGQQTAF